MLTGFKDFVLRGNIVELAVAVVIGSAFAALVASLGAGVINPVIASLGGADVDGLSVVLVDGNEASTVDIGLVITAAIQFLLTAAVVYFVFVLPMNTLAARRRRDEIPAEDAPAPDVELLTEIRDLLRAQQRPT